MPFTAWEARTVNALRKDSSRPIRPLEPEERAALNRGAVLKKLWMVDEPNPLSWGVSPRNAAVAGGAIWAGVLGAAIVVASILLREPGI
jgi:hypothetical protein